MTRPRIEVPVTRVVVTRDERDEAFDLINERFKYGHLAMGRLTEEFEECFGARHRAPHAVAAASGTAALEILYRAAAAAGAGVVVPANTFYATAAAAYLAGARCVHFADSRPDSPFPSVDSVHVACMRSADVTGRPPAAVAWVHIGGIVDPEIDRVANYCRENNIALVEDAAHAHGCSLDGRFPGSWGLGAAFSFYPTKVITAGEGGMVLTGDRGVADLARCLRDHGRAKVDGRAAHVRLAGNWRMSEANAAFGLVQARRLGDIGRERQRIAAQYDARLGGDARLRLHRPAQHDQSTFYKVILTAKYTDSREVFRAKLLDRGINLAGGVYDQPLNEVTAFPTEYRSPMPNAEAFAGNHFCVPVYRGMTEAEVDAVCDAVLEFV